MKVIIPTPLRQYTLNQAVVEVSGVTVGDALKSLTEKYPDLKKQLFNEGGTLRAFVNVYRNDEDVRYLEKDLTPVGPDDTLSIVPSIAGGNESFSFCN
jgi:molybdopterin converting factor small subunit